MKQQKLMSWAMDLIVEILKSGEISIGNPYCGVMHLFIVDTFIGNSEHFANFVALCAITNLSEIQIQIQIQIDN